MTKQVITSSDRAADRVKAIMAKAKEPIVGVRVGVASGGCAGMSYVLEYAKKANPNEILGKRQDLTPIKIQEIAKKFKDAGATILGGCCETNPSHIKAIAKIK